MIKKYSELAKDPIEEVISKIGCSEIEEQICKRYGWGYYTQGGCHAFAEALQNVFGGELIGDPQHHVFLYKNGFYYDADGKHSNPGEQIVYLCGLSAPHSKECLKPLHKKANPSAVKEIEAEIKKVLK